MDIFSWTLLVVAGGSLLALSYAVIKTKWIFKQPVENLKLKKIGGFVADGAMAFMMREYKVLIPFVLFVTAFLAIDHIAGKRQMDTESQLLALKYRSDMNPGTLINWMIRNDFPKGFQILCHSCNVAKRDNGKCPLEGKPH